MKAFYFLFLQCVVLLLVAGTVRAGVVIQYSGCYDGTGSTVATNEVANWLDKTVEKSFDGDGDNRYGTSGFLQVKYAGSWDKNWPGNKANWGWGGSGGQTNDSDFYPANDARVNIDDNPGSRTGVATICQNKPYSGMIAKKGYSHIRIGVANDVLYNSTGYNDNTTLECRVYSNSNLNTLLGSFKINLDTALNDKSADMYFFDVLGVSNGNYVGVWGDNYAGIITADEVKYTTNTQKSFSGSIGTDVNSATIMNQDSDVLSSVVVSVPTANSLAISGLIPQMGYSIKSTVAGAEVQLACMLANSAGNLNVKNVQNLAGITNLSIEAITTPTLGNGNIFIDLQGVNQTAGGQMNPPATSTEGGTWNAFEFQAHSGTPTLNPAMLMVDSAGMPTSVVLTIKGNVTGWAGNGPSGTGNAMKQDYMFAYAGNAAKAPYEWELTGLNPGDWYELELFTGNVSNRPSWFTVYDSWDMQDETRLIQTNESDIWLVQADEFGKIEGLFASQISGNGWEQDWAGMTIKASEEPLPEPTTWVMLVLGVLGLGFLRKRR